MSTNLIRLIQLFSLHPRRFIVPFLPVEVDVFEDGFPQTHLVNAHLKHNAHMQHICVILRYVFHFFKILTPVTISTIKRLKNLFFIGANIVSGHFGSHLVIHPSRSIVGFERTIEVSIVKFSMMLRLDRFR